MLNLFGKKSNEMVNGMLYLKKVTEEQAIGDLVKINDLLGNNIYGTQRLADALVLGTVADTIHVPVLTTRKTWQKIKESGLKLVATSEKVVAC